MNRIGTIKSIIYFSIAINVPNKIEVVLVESLCIFSPKFIGLVSWRPAKSIGGNLQRVLVKRAHIHHQCLQFLIYIIDIVRNVRIFNLTLLHELDDLFHLRLKHAQTIGLRYFRGRWFFEQILFFLVTRF
jgi:hypothetical protein